MKAFMSDQKESRMYVRVGTLMRAFMSLAGQSGARALLSGFPPDRRLESEAAMDEARMIVAEAGLAAAGPRTYQAPLGMLTMVAPHTAACMAEALAAFVEG